jgi:hypothetical protein
VEKNPKWAYNLLNGKTKIGMLGARDSAPWRDYMNKLGLFLLLLVAVGAVYANTLGTLPGAVNDLCYALTTLLPVVAMLMVVVAGVIYAAGQIMGAETRARANVWATAALTGALIALLIYAIAPAVLASIYGTGFNAGIAGGTHGGTFCGLA